MADQTNRPAPVRLHDLRHGVATFAHTVGVDIKTIQDQLGHASVVLTADTYTSVLPATHFRAAEATARLILRTARGTRSKIKKKAQRNAPNGPRAKPPPRHPQAPHPQHETPAHKLAGPRRQPETPKHPSAAEQHPKPAVDKTTPQNSRSAGGPPGTRTPNLWIKSPRKGASNLLRRVGILCPDFRSRVQPGPAG
jgi:hypothetical protein